MQAGKFTRTGASCLLSFFAFAAVASVDSVRAQSDTTIENAGNYEGSSLSLAVANDMNDQFEIVGGRLDAQTQTASDFFAPGGATAPSSFGGFIATGITNGTAHLPHQISGAAYRSDGVPAYARWYQGGGIEFLTLPASPTWNAAVEALYPAQDPSYPLRINSGSPIQTLLGKGSYNTDPACAPAPLSPECAATLQDFLFFVQRSANPSEPTPPLAYLLQLDGNPNLGRHVSRYYLNDNRDLIFDVDQTTYFFDGTTLQLSKVGSGFVPVGLTNARLAPLVGPAGSVLWSPAGSIVIGSSNGGIAVATAIAQNGVVTGRLVTGNSAHAFLFSAARGLRDLNDFLPPHSGWELLEGNHVNSGGGVEGLGLNQGALQHYVLRLASPDPDAPVRTPASIVLGFDDLNCLRKKRVCSLAVTVTDAQRQPVAGQYVAVQTPKKIRVHRKRITIDQTLAAGATDSTGTARFVIRLKSKPVLRAAVIDASGAVAAGMPASGYVTYRAPRK